MPIPFWIFIAIIAMWVGYKAGRAQLKAEIKYKAKIDEEVAEFSHALDVLLEPDKEISELIEMHRRYKNPKVAVVDQEQVATERIEKPQAAWGQVLSAEDNEKWIAASRRATTSAVAETDKAIVAAAMNAMANEQAVIEQAMSEAAIRVLGPKSPRFEFEAEAKQGGPQDD